ncbi:MAG: hypothetical protein JOZ58_01260 [Acetobacteraceae bacterium]|nr:hypothetical protein [Acetobacteraceae bacterium]
MPADLVPWLDRYLAEVRPRFPGAGSHAALWAGFKGRGLTGQAVYAAISERTAKGLGQAVNPHLFRSCAATTIAIVRPGQIGIARDLLAHSKLESKRPPKASPFYAASL